jgi:mRNA interferase MazF
VRRSGTPGGGTGAPRAGDIRRGEIWLAALDPTIGAEIQKTRPCVVVSPPEMHDFLHSVTVAPMTTGGHPAPYRIPLRFRGKDGLILLDQMRTLDQATARAPVRGGPGQYSPPHLAALREMLEE